MNNFSETANFLWTIAELLRDTFKRSKYQDVILPFTVLRRIDCVHEPAKDSAGDSRQAQGQGPREPHTAMVQGFW